MAIADITLLSGFEPKTEDLDLVSGSIGFHGLHVYRYSMINFFYLHILLYSPNVISPFLTVKGRRNPVHISL